MRIYIFAYLQIDVMLKQLHNNRDSECSGLLLCNHLNLHSQSTSYILLRDLSEITTGKGSGFESTHSLEYTFTFSKSSKKGS